MTTSDPPDTNVAILSYRSARSVWLIGGLLFCVGIAGILLLAYRNANTLAFRNTEFAGREYHLEIYQDRNDSVSIRAHKVGGWSLMSHLADFDEGADAEITLSDDQRVATFRYGRQSVRLNLEDGRFVSD